MNKTSWHYKLLDKAACYPKTVPGYWFAVVMLCIVYTIPYIILGLLVIIMGFAGMDFTGGWFSSMFYDWIAGFIVSMIFICGIIIAVIVLLYIGGTVMDFAISFIRSGKWKLFKFKKVDYE